MSLMLLSTLATANTVMIITKSASSSSYDALGQNITNNNTVTNSGNVSFTGNIIVADNRTGAFSITSSGLNVGQNVTGTANYTITQPDLDAGYVPNSAYATATNGFQSNNTIAAITAAQTPTITWSNPVNITYGTKLNKTQLDANASNPVTGTKVAGTFVIYSTPRNCTERRYADITD